MLAHSLAWRFAYECVLEETNKKIDLYGRQMSKKESNWNMHM